MPYVAHNGLSRTQHFARREAHERWRRDYLETLARHHAKRTGLSLPVACRIVTALSIVAKEPAPELPDYAHFEDALTRERTPTLNTVRRTFLPSMQWPRTWRERPRPDPPLCKVY